MKLFQALKDIHLSKSGENRIYHQHLSGIDFSGITTVSIYDFTGKLVSSEKINLNKQNTVSVNTLLNGVYMVKISSNSIDYNQKIIVSR
ncbi:T9SS type A sorting domain-containing protein [Chryseobacterium sp. PTM-20240506]|uniref:T9SS type A sorting domain-containing protein n=1 Tax=unclassified Chryseobacterium TaxID=2593645 RepID=UPI0023582509|nr:T9SS type A sorting domain-containing protein [Chryseobacterium sp. B21-037]MDC8107145.1 T9SS type A sorting domain-containing protein [Chryseobacterium sp. B21-037]WBV56340.1 T9SS type A sorting domain-containing protein [Chryseobacterium daecheongense]